MRSVFGVVSVKSERREPPYRVSACAGAAIALAAVAAAIAMVVESLRSFIPLPPWKDPRTCCATGRFQTFQQARCRTSRRAGRKTEHERPVNEGTLAVRQQRERDRAAPGRKSVRLDARKATPRSVTGQKTASWFLIKVDSR